MNSFENMGQARIDAVEGQRLIAVAALKWLRQTTVRLFDAVGRRPPQSKSAPW